MREILKIKSEREITNCMGERGHKWLEMVLWGINGKMGRIRFGCDRKPRVIWAYMREFIFLSYKGL